MTKRPQNTALKAARRYISFSLSVVALGICKGEKSRLWIKPYQCGCESRRYYGYQSVKLGTLGDSDFLRKAREKPRILLFEKVAMDVGIDRIGWDEMGWGHAEQAQEPGNDNIISDTTTLGAGKYRDWNV